MSESQFPDAHEKWLNCQGRQFKKLAYAGLIWLERHHQAVNALNVFPVPDGDTGTNMLLTMRSAYKRVQDSEETHVGKVAAQLAQGALMGARGNSGVILSQIWRGLAHSLKNKETFDALGMAAAFQEASNTAYNGVMKPVEGTILTVVREAAEEAKDAARKGSDLRFVLDRVLERAYQALERTPDLLPVLKQAGVVDSGGKGFVYILEGMMRYLQGELTEAMMAGEDTTSLVQTPSLPAQAYAVPEGGSLEFPYDVQFILMGQNLNVGEVRGRIDSMGDSTVVVGDNQTIKVHVHVKDPGVPLSYGVSIGQITDVVVENMQEQMETIVNTSNNNGKLIQLLPEEALTVQPGQVAVIAIAPGKGLMDVFHSLGVAFVVDGGQTNNPSTEEIFQALHDVPTDKIVILPNNKNIILAAEAARDISPKQVVVVPTRTIPQGVAAMLSWSADGELAEVAEAMQTASRTVATGQITYATRTVTLDGVDVAEGNMIGLTDSKLCASGPDIASVLGPTLAKMNLTEREILTVYYGDNVTLSEAEQLVALIEAQYPDIEVELIYGGQPHYHYILGAE
ncbi:MAG: DAK2 domain-containing protein [Chloroflexi bacterium]|nr:DAK2 domain-containing protein [Chloroflexota bacterium]